MDWKEELDAIIGARHGGASDVLLKRLRELDARHPNVPEIQSQIAWTCEMLGKCEESLAAYDRAMALGLPPNEHAGAIIGSASCLLYLHRFEKAEALLASARVQFPNLREFEAFHALALQSCGRGAEAMQILLVLLAETSEDPGIAAYQRSLRHLAANLVALQTPSPTSHPHA
jgi:tetratricopeptide (TPR) repeat protein